MVRRIGEQRRAKLLMELIKGERDVVEIAEKFGMNVRDLMYWISLPENWTVLEDVARLNDAQARMQLSRYRRQGIWKLAALATSGSEKLSKEDDVARRACVDLLKMQMRPAQASSQDGQDEMNDQELLRFFNQMAETREQLDIASQRQHLDAEVNQPPEVDSDE